MSSIPRPQQIYKDSEGNSYQIISLAEHTESKETFVIYQAMYGDFKVYAKELSLFLEKEVKEKETDAGAEASTAANAESEQTIDIDPLVLDFLDAGTYEERLDILDALHHRITDDMINTMAVALDVEVKEGDIEQRYTELRKCLLLFDKFECSRLR